jgi:hypothetical protein
MTRLAEAGCSVHEIQAFSGHKTLSEIAHYTSSVEQAALARKAMAKTPIKLSKNAKMRAKTTAESLDGGPGSGDTRQCRQWLACQTVANRPFERKWVSQQGVKIGGWRCRDLVQGGGPDD